MQCCAKKLQSITQLIRHNKLRCALFVPVFYSIPPVHRTILNAIATTTTWVGTKLSITALRRLGAYIHRRVIIEGLTEFTPNHALIQAILTNRPDQVQALIDEGVNLEDQIFNQGTPLHLAARNGRTEIVHILINSHANLEAQNADQETSLHLAVREGHTEIARELINARANLAALNDFQETPLNVAERRKRIEIIRLLVQAGAK